MAAKGGGRADAGLHQLLLLQDMVVRRIQIDAEAGGLHGCIGVHHQFPGARAGFPVHGPHGILRRVGADPRPGVRVLDRPPPALHAPEDRVAVREDPGDVDPAGVDGDARVGIPVQLIFPFVVEGSGAEGQVADRVDAPLRALEGVAAGHLLLRPQGENVPFVHVIADDHVLRVLEDRSPGDPEAHFQLRDRDLPQIGHGLGEMRLLPCVDIGLLHGDPRLGPPPPPARVGLPEQQEDRCGEERIDKHHDRLQFSVGTGTVCRSCRMPAAASRSPPSPPIQRWTRTGTATALMSSGVTKSRPRTIA